ncbi:MAG: G8 domain-containing protein, partial [Pseudomonadota bacterium]
MDTTNNTNGMTEMGEDHAMVASMGQMPAMALVELSDVTHTAVQSGAWSDPNTWADGLIPDDAARAHIPEGLTVIIDGIFSEELKTLRLDGVLSFANDTDTELRLDTLVTMPGSHLIIGTETAPISADVDARIVFADDGAIDQTWDPTLISRGALIHGETTIFGAEKLAFTSLETPVSAGSTSIMLSEDPTGWRVGDEITIAGTEAGNPLSDEVVTITQIVGRVVTFAQALQYDHVPPRADLDVHVANLTRNVQFSSENSETGHAGHVMFMHTNDADIRYFSMEGLGRTDKALGVDDWQLASPSEGSLGPELTEVLELGGDNVRGRYSLHFHRGGDDTPAAHVEGAVVRDDPGWAYVNHSSNVDFIGNVSHNVVGAAYNTEAGDEIGSFIGNIAIRTYNPNGDPNPPDFELNEDQSPDIRVLTQDFGWQGDGFWLHGPGVVVDNNVVAGASGHAYIYWPLGLVEEGLGEALAEVDIDGVPVEVRPKQIEVPSFDGNIAYGAPKALNVAYLHTDNRDDNDEHQVLEGLLAPVPQSYEDQLQSTFSNFTAWNIDLNAIAAPYSGRLTFENIDIIGTGVGGSIGVKLDQFDNENDITVRNVTIDGFEVGLAAQRQGEGLIDGARIAANGSDIRISMPDGAPRELDIRNVEFLDESLIFSDMSERVNINMDAAHDLGLAGGLFGDPEGFFDEENLINVPPIFLPDRITYQTADGEVAGLYFDLQDPNFIPVVPDGELSRFVSEDIVGLTNSELYEQYGFAAGGVPAPSNISQGLADGGFSGAPAELNATFPPEPNEYWVDYLAQFGVEIPWQE